MSKADGTSPTAATGWPEDGPRPRGFAVNLPRPRCVYVFVFTTNEGGGGESPEAPRHVGGARGGGGGGGACGGGARGGGWGRLSRAVGRQRRRSYALTVRLFLCVAVNPLRSVVGGDGGREGGSKTVHGCIGGRPAHRTPEVQPLLCPASSSTPPFHFFFLFFLPLDFFYPHQKKTKIIKKQKTRYHFDPCRFH